MVVEKKYFLNKREGKLDVYVKQWTKHCTISLEQGETPNPFQYEEINEEEVKEWLLENQMMDEDETVEEALDIEECEI